MKYIETGDWVRIRRKPTDKGDTFLALVVDDRHINEYGAPCYTALPDGDASNEPIICEQMMASAVWDVVE